MFTPINVQCLSFVWVSKNTFHILKIHIQRYFFQEGGVGGGGLVFDEIGLKCHCKKFKIGVYRRITSVSLRKRKDTIIFFFQMEENTKRKKATISTDLTHAFRKKQAADPDYQHVRLCRSPKKLAKKCEGKGVVETDKGYKTPQSLGKAVKRLQQALPKSPSKQRAVVAKLARIVGLEVVDTSLRCNHPGNNKHGLCGEDIQSISDFYYRQDISYAMPGTKDHMTVWENGKKSRLRKHYLVMFLREAFALFTESHPNVRVGFSKFASLRPKNVLLLKHQSADQCKCQIHENFMYKLDGLGIRYDDGFWQSVLCDGSHGDFLSLCWKGECENCSRCTLVVEGSNEKTVYCKEWITKKDGHLRLIEHRICMGQLRNDLIGNFSSMREHVRVKRIQAAAYAEDKQNVNGHVLHVDFAMAYSCEYQNEIQGALWSRKSVNLFTAALYSRGQACKSFLVVTDFQEKGKDAVFTFISKLLESIEIGPVDTFTIFSDGPASEFKNKFMVRFVFLLSRRLKVQFIWKYFATSHGKGVVDGIGGSAKSLVRKCAMSKGRRAGPVQSSKDFFDIVSKNMPQVTTIHVSDSEVRKYIETQNPWQGVKEAHRIAKAHMLLYREGGVDMFKTSKGAECVGGVEYEKPKQNVKVGDWEVILQ